MEGFLVVCATVVMCVGLVWGCFALANWKNDVDCHAKWEDSFKPEYNFFGGCTIEVNGVRIPSANYRVL